MSMENFPNSRPQIQQMVVCCLADFSPASPPPPAVTGLAGVGMTALADALSSVGFLEALSAFDALSTMGFWGALSAFDAFAPAHFAHRGAWMSSVEALVNARPQVSQDMVGSFEAVAPESLLHGGQYIPEVLLPGAFPPPARRSEAEELLFNGGVFSEAAMLALAAATEAVGTEMEEELFDNDSPLLGLQLFKCTLSKLSKNARPQFGQFTMPCFVALSCTSFLLSAIFVAGSSDGF